jgi:hypothetical protein
MAQGVDAQMDESRKLFPHYFCHKFGWTQNSMADELRKIGFAKVKTKRAGTNFVAFAVK